MKQIQINDKQHHLYTFKSSFLNNYFPLIKFFIHSRINIKYICIEKKHLKTNNNFLFVIGASHLEFK